MELSWCLLSEDGGNVGKDISSETLKVGSASDEKNKNQLRCTHIEDEKNDLTLTLLEVHGIYKSVGSTMQ